MKYSDALYGFEVIGSIFLVVHGLLGMTLLEYIKRLCLIKVMQIYTRVALFLYMFDALLRTAMYFKIKHLLVDVEEGDSMLSFGGYLAVYCENEAFGVIVSAVLLGSYSICFLSTCYMWRLTNQLHGTAIEVEQDKQFNSLDKSSRSSSSTLRLDSDADGLVSPSSGDKDKLVV